MLQRSALRVKFVGVSRRFDVSSARSVMPQNHSSKLVGLSVLCVLITPKCGVGFFDFQWTPVVEIPQGKLRGIAEETHDKYLAIPYATVEKKFQAPGDPPNWKNTYDAIQGRTCIQLVPLIQLPLGSEDCLILNIYVPKNASPERPAPVMLFIHGGGFYLGGSSSLILGAEPLVEKGVVVVTITYRLGSWGFLCLEIEEAPGNAGLKDQLAALRWVNKNIRFFGGDPTSVTIFGESAGAASVHFMIISKAARGLFHRAILESSTAISPFIMSLDPIGRASRVAEKLGFKTVDPKVLLQIYSNASRNELLMATDSDEITEKFSFTTCIEKEIPGIEPIFTESPYTILQSGSYNKVPTIIGYNNKEGLYFIRNPTDEAIEKANSNFEIFLPENLAFPTIDVKKAVTQLVKDFYFDGQPISRGNVNAMVDFTSDAFFHVHAVRSTELHLNTSSEPVFNYYFKYNSFNNFGKVLVAQVPFERGATHTDELFYLFRPSFRLTPLNGRDGLMTDRMTQLWTDFAKTGNPTPSPSELLPNAWRASDANQLRFYSLDDSPHMRSLPNAERIQFWKELYDKYGIK